MQLFRYRLLCALMIAGIACCCGCIAHLLLQGAPRAQVFADATLVWEGFSHAHI